MAKRKAPEGSSTFGGIVMMFQIRNQETTMGLYFGTRVFMMHQPMI